MSKIEFNRKIFITGGSSGLGKSIILESINQDIEVYYHQRKKNILNEKCVFGDLKNENTINKICNFIEENDINVFINNAGIYLNEPLLFTDISSITDILKINLEIPIILTKKILEIFNKKGYGMIYNINSLAGIKGTKNESIYGASKYGLKGFTDSLIDEYRDNKNIRIVNVILGAFKSKITKNRENYDDLGDPKEVADCILKHILGNYKTINNDLIITRK